MDIGLYFGTFNPVHRGHASIATFFLSHFSQVWIIPSPQSPHKLTENGLNFNQRLQALKLVFSNVNHCKVLDIEKKLPRPSYTINTLRKLKKDFPATEFSVIMGSDNLKNLKQWKDIDEIINLLKEISVYPRGNDKLDKTANTIEKIRYYDTGQLIQISSSEIRTQIRLKKVKCLENNLPQSVYKYIINELNL